MNKIKIVFSPFDNQYNKYIDLMKNAYGSFADVAKFSVKNFFSHKNFVLNWYESRKFIKFIVVMLLLKITNKKIIWVMHNKLPHDTKNKFLSSLKMKIIANFADKIIIHSKISEKELKKINDSPNFSAKIAYIPHPNYIETYGKIAENKICGDKLKLLFFGMIKPYKNVELLIDTFNELNLENLELSIYGFAQKNYAKKLREKIANNKNIKYDFGFIDDNKIPQIFAQNHILATPYNLESALNSGSVILAFSYKRTVLSPNNGTLSDIENKNMFFAYEYENSRRHKEILKEKILDLYQNYSDDYNRLLELGKDCFEYAQKNNSPEKISEKLKVLFAEKSV
ncbi:MAG: glycosyltransferase [Chitinivibrionia bacterium]|nr:glycosyltransferase [Chitinivibrionia bacterium]